MEVDSKSVTNQLYRDLVYNNVAYGAERWVVALQRMCERIACSLTHNITSDEAAGGMAFNFLTLHLLYSSVSYINLCQLGLQLMMHN